MSSNNPVVSDNRRSDNRDLTVSLNAGQKHCRMLQGEHSAILLTFIKLPFFIKTFVLCIFEWSLICHLPKLHKWFCSTEQRCCQSSR